MEEQLNPLAVTHLLQHTLRSLCLQDNSQWIYAVFWRILPRNYPPPKWDLHAGAYDRTRGNRRNWILVWEDGFCNFPASTCQQIETAGGTTSLEDSHQIKGLQPEIFFKMSHEIYNFGEGLVGKVAADHSHKWVFKEPQEHEINFLSSWNNPADTQPRTWEAQFQSGIQTIALIAVREGVVQLGAVNKVMEDLSFVVLLRKKFNYIESIPGVLLPHPSSSAFPPMRMEGCNGPDHHHWPLTGYSQMPPPMEFHDHFNQQVRVTPSMSSLEALLSKLPAVVPPSNAFATTAGGSSQAGYFDMQMLMQMQAQKLPMVTKEEIDEEYSHERTMELGGESSSSISYFVNASKSGDGF